jgi:hypothetical protein
MPQLEIITVSNESDLDAFINLPWKIYAKDTIWVPPLKKQVRRLLDPAKHPFWKFSERVLFLARRGSETVGRIAGIVDDSYNQFHNEKMGAWGFFECENDPEAAAGLFSAVEDWVSSKAMTFLRGPLNPSTNYEVGLLIEGFEHPPAFMMTYNPGYYADLVESFGFEKEKDLLSFLLVKNDRANARVNRLARRLRRKSTIRIRSAEKKNFHSEMSLIQEIYDEAWSPNWGFVPMTEDEVLDVARELVRIVDPSVICLVYYDEKPVGVSVMLPDISPLLKRLDGKVGLLGLLKILIHRRDVKGTRALIFGFKKSHQGLGLPVVLFDYLNQFYWEKYDYSEFGWTLEDNTDINKFVSELGAKMHNKWRIYRKSLTPSTT